MSILEISHDQSETSKVHRTNLTQPLIINRDCGVGARWNIIINKKKVKNTYLVNICLLFWVNLLGQYFT